MAPGASRRHGISLGGHRSRPRSAERPAATARGDGSRNVGPSFDTGCEFGTYGATVMMVCGVWNMI